MTTMVTIDGLSGPAHYQRNERIITDVFGGKIPPLLFYSRKELNRTDYILITLTALVAIACITLIILHCYGMVDLDPKMLPPIDSVVNVIK